jgi:hypothetical protein
MTTHRTARPNSSALVPGVALWREIGKDNYPRWRLRASAQVEGRQETRSWGVSQRRTLAEALGGGMPLALRESAWGVRERGGDAAGRTHSD